MSMRNLTSVVSVSLVVLIGLAIDANANAQGAIRSLEQIAPGTIVPNEQSAVTTTRWNRVVLLAKPQIVSGDIDSLSAGIRQAATSFTLTLLASVTPATQADGSTKYQLREVGVGYSYPIGGQPTVLTAATAKQLGASLGFIQSRVLEQNEQNLPDVRVVVQTTTLLIFDTPAIMLRSGQHRDFTTRHMVWVDPNSGSSATLVWLLGKDASGNMVPANEPLKLVPPGTKELRRIHIDGNQFFFGVPNKYAFALEDLPPGKKIQWTRELAGAAAHATYDADRLSRLSAALNPAIASSDKANKAPNSINR